MPGMPTIAQIHVTMDENRKLLGADGKPITSRTGGKNTDPTDTGSPQNSKANKDSKSLIRNTLGINVGMAAMWKQSQIFTGVVGTIFQLIGALVDVILAPFLPIVVPAIKLISKAIPIAATVMRKIFEKLTPIWDFFTDKFDILPESINNKLSATLSTLLLVSFFAKVLGLWGPWMSVMKLTAEGIWFTIKVLRSLVGRVVGLLGRLTGGIVEGIGDLLWRHVGKKLTTLASEIFTPIRARLNSILTKLTKLASEIFSPITSRFTTLFDNLVAALDNLIARLNPLGGGGGGSLVDDVAKNTVKVLKGIWRGGRWVIQDMPSSVGAWLKGVATSSGTVMDKPPTVDPNPPPVSTLVESKFLDHLGRPMTIQMLEDAGYVPTKGGGIEKIVKALSPAQEMTRFVRAIAFVGTIIEGGIALWTTGKEAYKVSQGESDWQAVMELATIGTVATGMSAWADIISLKPGAGLPTGIVMQVATSYAAEKARQDTARRLEQRLFEMDNPGMAGQSGGTLNVNIHNPTPMDLSVDFNGTPIEPNYGIVIP